MTTGPRRRMYCSALLGPSGVSLVAFSACCCAISASRDVACPCSADVDCAAAGADRPTVNERDEARRDQPRSGVRTRRCAHWFPLAAPPPSDAFRREQGCSAKASFYIGMLCAVRRRSPSLRLRARGTAPAVRSRTEADILLWVPSRPVPAHDLAHIRSRPRRHPRRRQGHTDEDLAAQAAAPAGGPTLVEHAIRTARALEPRNRHAGPRLPGRRGPEFARERARTCSSPSRSRSWARATPCCRQRPHCRASVARWSSCTATCR